jgi:hypothetical protein
MLCNQPFFGRDSVVELACNYVCLSCPGTCVYQVSLQKDCSSSIPEEPNQALKLNQFLLQDNQLSLLKPCFDPDTSLLVLVVLNSNMLDIVDDTQTPVKYGSDCPGCITSNCLI